MIEPSTSWFDTYYNTAFKLIVQLSPSSLNVIYKLNICKVTKEKGREKEREKERERGGTRVGVSKKESGRGMH